MDHPAKPREEEERLRPQPNQRLVQVFDAKEESEALVVRGLLESQGIEAMLSGRDADQETWPGVGGCFIRVRQEQAEQARRIIEEYSSTPLLEDAEPTDDSEGPA